MIKDSYLKKRFKIYNDNYFKLKSLEGSLLNIFEKYLPSIN